MKDFTSDEIGAYAQKRLIIRTLIFVECKDRTTGAPVDFGFWNGSSDGALDVVDGITQATVSRSFDAGGGVLTVGDIAYSDKLDAIAVAAVLSQLQSDVESAIRGYDMRNAPIQIYRALFNKDNPRALVAPARCRFAGFVNTAPLATPPEGGNASLTLNCVGCTRELTRTNTDLRSDESQQRRNADDRFFRWVGATGQVQVFWGQNKSVA